MRVEVVGPSKSAIAFWAGETLGRRSAFIASSAGTDAMVASIVGRDVVDLLLRCVLRT